MRASRRSFLRTATAAGTLSSFGAWNFLGNLPAVSAEEAKPDGNVVALAPEIEPLVRVLEETPRDKLLEEMADRIHRGTTYREVVAALLLAGVRNVPPRPQVGFKFHAVLVVNSAHLASLASPDEERWLPIFWALDYFKDSQAKTVSEGGWRMPPVDESKLPVAHAARQMFIDGMENWDEAKVDLATAALARSASAGELFDLFSRYGCRDFRAIGHKIIFVSNGFRTLQMIGWQHAEPVLRSLAFAMLNHTNEANPADSDLAPDRPGRENLSRIKTLRSEWLEGKVDAAATKELVATLRTASANEACAQVVEMINRGVAVQSIWDALFLGSGELLMRQPGIAGLHTLTSTNALHFAFRHATHPETRQYLLLQNVAFLPMFRENMQGRGKLAELNLLELEPADGAGERASLDKVFGEISRDKLSAAKLALAYARENPNSADFHHRARQLVFLKGRDSHDYKFSSAVLEDSRQVSPAFRDRFLASSVFNLRGSGGGDNPLVERTRQALKA